MTRSIMSKLMAAFCALMMIVGSMSISTYAEESELEIINQPTADNPTVTVNKDDVAYQWYKADVENETALADMTGKIVNGEIIASETQAQYVGDGMWFNENGNIDLKTSLLEGDILQITHSSGDKGKAALGGLGLMLFANNAGEMWCEVTEDKQNLRVYVYPEESESVSAKLQIKRDGETYPIVSGMKKVIEGKINVYTYYGDYISDAKWSSDSDNELKIRFYAKENQIIKIDMTNVNGGILSIASEMLTMPASGEYSYIVSKSGYCDIKIENGSAFEADITVADLCRGQAVAGQTTNTLTAFEEGQSYSCLIKCGEEEVWSDYIDGELMIKTQPTVENPFVELNYDMDAEYQWYNVQSQLFTLVDKDELTDDEINIEYVYSGSYIDGIWKSEEYEEDEYYSCIDIDVNVNKGDKIIITLPENFDGFVYDYDTGEGYIYNNGVYEYVVNTDKGYVDFFIYADEAFTAKVQVEKREIGDAVTGQTDAELEDYEYGKTYVCKIATDNEIIISNYVEIVTAISSQPTATNPAVEVNFVEKVEGYQWYHAYRKTIKVVDRDLVSDDNEVVEAFVYYGTNENGCWKSEYETEPEEYNEKNNAIDVRLNNLKNGDIVKVIPSENFEGDVCEYYSMESLKCRDGEYYYIITDEVYFNICMMSDEEFTVEIIVDRLMAGDAVAGQTGKEISNYKVGDYICELTLKNGTKIWSDVVSFTKAYKTGWQLIDGIWYYYNENAEVLTGWQLINGVWYYMNANGAMQTGWVLDGGTWYYMNGSGAMQTGWVLDGGTWYYMNGSGAMQTGWQLIGGTWYYMNGSGAMQTGWQLIGGTWYYMNGSGAMQTGWQLIGGTWYYMNESGAMQTGWQLIDGKWYYFNTSGAWVA